jgi:transcriptional regulator NrdR family protein
LKGYTCPTPACNHHKLLVQSKYVPTAKLIVRYRRCPLCGYRETTEERPKPARRTEAP